MPRCEASRFGDFVSFNSVFEAVRNRYGEETPEKRLAMFRQLAGNDPLRLFEGLDLIRDAKDNRLLLDTVRGALLTRPGYLDGRRLESFLRNDDLPPAERTAVLAEVYAKAGGSNLLKQLVTVGKGHESLKASPEFTRFANLGRDVT